MDRGSENNCTTQHFTINPTQRLTPTGCRVVTRSKIEGLNQDKSTVSCVNHRVPHTLKPEQYCPGYPRGRLSVVKHRQCRHTFWAWKTSLICQSLLWCCLVHIFFPVVYCFDDFACPGCLSCFYPGIFLVSSPLQ